MRTKTRDWMLPREHGAWAMFAVPLLVGIGAAHTFSLPTILFALTAFGFFLLRYPLMMAIKSRASEARRIALRCSAIYAALTGIAGAWLLLASRLWLLIPMGALGAATLAMYLLLAARRAEMSIAGEWIGIAGLTLGAPGAYLVSSGTLDMTALALYALNLLYFSGTVLYIKFKVREQPRAATAIMSLPARLWTGRTTLVYHVMLLLIGASLAAIGFVPALAAIAFLLPTCKVFAGVAMRPARLNLKRLGFIELGFTVAFAFAVVAAYH